ncbi:MAG: OmpA family protein [Verrucomicrobiota bacterium]
MSTPPLPPPPPPGARKPSALASCILLGIILVFVGGLGGGGFWAYKKYIAKPKTDGGEVADSGQKKPEPPKTPETPPAKETPVPAPPAPETPPENDPLAAKPSGETPPAEPKVTPLPEPPVTPQIADNGLQERPVVPAPPVKVETPPPAEVKEAPPVTPPAPESADPVVAPEPVQTYAENAPEVTSLKEDADRRIDEAPADIYSDADKDKVREAIRQAKRLTRVATLQFGKGAAALGANERKRLKEALLTPEAESLLSDPQAVFFLIGFADSTGASQANRSLSQKRAAGIGSVLKSFRVTNRAYAVGIGSSNLVGGALQDKNRAVEVWVVLP